MKIRTFLSNTLGKFITQVDWLNVPATTYVRYILAIVAALNTLLNAFDVNPINVDESQLYDIVSAILCVVILFVNTYKDNPTSTEAIAANRYMHELKEKTATMEKEDNVEETETAEEETEADTEEEIEVEVTEEEVAESEVVAEVDEVESESTDDETIEEVTEVPVDEVVEEVAEEVSEETVDETPADDATDEKASE